MLKGAKIMAKRMWELKQAAAADALDLYIYGDVEDVAIDWVKMTYVESENSAKFFREELAAHPDVKQINVYVNSPGGYVLEAMAIRNQLKRHPANVTGIVDGFACSAASFILTGCNEVKMYSNTMQMVHNMWSIAIGNSKEMHKVASDLEVIMVGNRKAYLEKSGGKLTEEKLMELLDAESWLTAEQCLAYGLCDEIIAEEVDLAKAKQILQKVNTTMEQQISYNKALAAQLRELAEPPKEPDPVPPEADLVPDPDPEPKENKFIKFMSAL